MLRFLILAFVVLWAGATIGRFTRRFGRGPLRPIRRQRPPPEPVPISERVVAILRTVVGGAVIVGFAVALFVFTDLPDIVVVLATAPVAGLVSTLLKERGPKQG